MMFIAEAVTSNWPSDSVWLAIVGIVAMIVKEIIDRTRNAVTVTKVEEVVKTLVKQDEKVQEQETKLDTIVKQTDGLLEKVGNIRQEQGELVGAETQRKRQLEIDAAVIVAQRAGVQAPVPVVIENPSPVPVVETNH